MNVPTQCTEYHHPEKMEMESGDFFDLERKFHSPIKFQGETRGRLGHQASGDFVSFRLVLAPLGLQWDVLLTFVRMRFRSVITEYGTILESQG